jgi:hypothetical protein
MELLKCHLTSTVTSRSVISLTASPLVAISSLGVVTISGALVLAIAWIFGRHGDRLKHAESETGSNINLVMIYASC